MKTLYIIALIFCSAITLSTKAQPQYWEWARGTVKPAYIPGMAADAFGNVYITGYFIDSLITFGSTTFVSPHSGHNYLIAKYNSSGNVIWAKDAPGPGLDNRGEGIITDAAGNVYVTGYYDSATITFGNITLTNQASPDYSSAFIAKYNPSGNIIWAKSIGGIYPTDGTYMCADTFGNIYITGWFNSDTITFGNVTLANSFPYAAAVFIAKYDAAGNVAWVTTVGGSTNNGGFAISTDAAANVYVTGNFENVTGASSTIVFGGTTFDADTINQISVFTAKLDSSGNFLWAKAGNSESTFALPVGMGNDAEGNVYETGYFITNLTFGNTTLTSQGTTFNSYIVKYNASGNLVWVKGGNGNYVNGSKGLSVDAEGDFCITGYFLGSIMIIGNDTLTGTAGNNFYVIKYDPSGNIIWAKTQGSDGSGDATAITTDANDNIYIAGQLQSAAVAFGNDTLTNAAFCIAKIGYCNPPLAPANTTSPSAQAVCAGNMATLTASGSGTLSWYSAPENGVCLGTGASFATPVVTTATTFYVLDSTCGISTTTAISVSINPNPMAVISLSGDDTLSTGSFSDYQWLTNNGIISTATGQSYMATLNGSYQVIVTDSNGCVDTSAKYSLTHLSITAINQGDNLRVYPNPSSAVFNFSGINAGSTIQVYNVLGEIIYTAIAYNSTYLLNLNNQAKGIYFYRVSEPGGQTTWSLPAVQAGRPATIQQGKIVLE